MPKNLKRIYEQERAWPAGLELRLNTIELYGWLVGQGGSVEGSEPQMLVETVTACAARQQDGYFYPEVAMYMQQPWQVLGVFMSHEGGFRVCIDNVQHGITAYNLYAESYDWLVAAGMPN